MRILLLLLFLIASGAPLAAWQWLGTVPLSGVVIDKDTKDTLSLTHIENKTGHKRVDYFSKGIFTINVKELDRITFSLTGYRSVEMLIMDATPDRFVTVKMERAQLALDTVKVLGLTQYQEDSLKRRLIFGKKVSEKPVKFKRLKPHSLYGGSGNGILTYQAPISSLIQKRTKTYKRLKAFQDRFKKDEAQAFVDSRYSLELVTELTALQGDSLKAFISAYPMPLDYARSATEVEVKMWVKYNYREWIKKP